MRKIVRNSKIRYTYTRDLDVDNNFFLFIYNPDTGKDYVFNRFSALIWEMLEYITTDEEIILQINSKLELDNIELYSREINKTINILIKHNLVVQII